ncbi:MAG: PH domain-containing protein [Chloroflexi bacterium]|nr:PH domain-containing protein [Chloroflexota bacterium]
MNGPEPVIGFNVKPEMLEEIKTKILDEHEQLLGVFTAQPRADRGGYKSLLRGRLVITDKRVIVWARGLGGGTEAFLYNDILSVEGSKGLVLGKVTLNLGGAKEIIDSMPNPEVDIAVKMIREQIQLARTQSQLEQVSDDIPAQIEKLAKLRDAGILTEEEFSAKKAELLARM